MHKLLLILVLYMWFGGFVNAQDPVYRSINNLNGLPSNTIYSIVQDANGFLWIGHDKGMSKYDGNVFKNFSTNNQQGRSLSSLLVANQQVWSQDFAGNFYYVNNDSLILEKKMSSLGFFLPIGIYRKNALYSFHLNKNRIYDLQTKRLTIIHIPKIKFLNNICYVGDTAYSYVNQSILRFVGAQEATLHTYQEQLPNIFYFQKIDSLFFGFAKSGDRNVYKFDSNKIVPLLRFPPNLFIQNVQLINNEVWVSTSTGAYCFDRRMNPKYNGFCFFKNTSIATVLEDREHNLLFGTINKGILIVPDLRIREYNFPANITSFTVDKAANEFIAGTASNSLIRYNYKNSTYKTIYTNATNHEVVHVFHDKKERINIICTNRIVIEKNNKKIQELDLSGKAVTKITDGVYAISISHGTILLKLKDSKAAFPNWLKEYYRLSSYPNVVFLAKSLVRGRSVLFNSTDSILYTATTEGLFYYSPKSSGEIFNKGKKIYATQLQLYNGVLYAATLNEGLILINQLQVKTQFNTSNNLLSNTIYKMHVYNNAVWMVSDAELQKLDLITKKVTLYNNSDGLPKSEIKDIVVLNEKVYLATVDGLVVFDAYQPSINNVPPLLHLNSFFVNQHKINYQPNIVFSANDNSIEINFSLLSFKANNNAIAQYRVNNGNWITLEKQNRTLSLPSLAAGSYKLVIRAINEDGIISKVPLEFNFFIQAPFYKQFWFVALLVILAMVIVYTYFKFRIKTIEQNNQLVSEKLQLEEALQRSMLSAIKSQMNPHFVFNALNTIQSYIYTNDKENASAYLSKFSELTRMILEMSNKDIVSLTDEIRSLELYLELEKIRFEDKLQYQLTIDEAISSDTTFVPSMLIQPYVENAIKHGLLHKRNNRLLLIDFKRSENGITVTIDDNGIGRKKSSELQKFKLKKHQSFALSANQKRLEILNKGLKNAISLMIIDKESVYGEALGTKVILHIPFSKQRG